MHEHATTTVPLNFSEHAYAAFDGFIGSMPQVYLLRFDRPVTAAQLKAVSRELVGSQDRLRGVIEPGWHRYHLRILADNHIVNQLFEHAWSETPHLDAASLSDMEQVHNRLINEILPLEHGLSCRFQFIDHPQTPVLFLTVHHLLGDGRTMIHLVTELMRRLNGGPPMVHQPAEAVSLLDALWPKSFWQRPLHIWRSRGHVQRQSAWLEQHHVQQFQSPEQPFLSTNAMRYYTPSVPVSSLRAAARRLGLSVNSLVVLALAETCLAQAPNDPQAGAAIRMSVDLRRYYPESAKHGPLWGNHVGAFLVLETGAKSLQARADSIKAQVAEGIARFERREMLWLYLMYEALPWLGRTVVGHLTTKLQRRLKMQRISCHATSLGNLNHLNPPESAIKLEQVIAAVPSLAALHVMAEFNDRMVMPLVWQRCEATVEQVDAYLQRLDQRLIALAA